MPHLINFAQKFIIEQLQWRSEILFRGKCLVKIGIMMIPLNKRDNLLAIKVPLYLY